MAELRVTERFAWIPEMDPDLTRNKKSIPYFHPSSVISTRARAPLLQRHTFALAVEAQVGDLIRSISSWDFALCLNAHGRS